MWALSTKYVYKSICPCPVYMLMLQKVHHEKNLNLAQFVESIYPIEYPRSDGLTIIDEGPGG